jgi:putative cardiolipin synthase
MGALAVHGDPAGAGRLIASKCAIAALSTPESPMRRIQWFLLLVPVLALTACAQLPPRPPMPEQTAFTVKQETPLDLVIAEAEARHPGQSGFRLVSEGPEAFALRARSAALAGRSLDVQTYIWHADLTGIYLAYRLLDAADRGVRVRLLLDDIDARAKNLGFAALDAHPGIEVRIFNPFASREGKLKQLGEALGSFKRINHRMHNKSWIADNRIAIVGGRNLGDEYFGASEEVNFVDLDFAMIGPVVRDASESFDRYWNSRAAYPMAVLDPDGVDSATLEALRTKATAQAREAEASRYAAELRGDDAVQRLAGGQWPMEWTAAYRFVSDDPLKALMEPGPQRSHVLTVLVPALRAAREEVTIISPYFVPGKLGTAGLVEGVQGGTRVRILTNSLAANDVAAVHGGYSRYREALLSGGVMLWELKPRPGSDVKSSLFGSSGASLHTKAFAVDGASLFVGSYNLDPRSTSLNCEQGVLVENAVLAKQLEALFAAQSAAQRAWAVTLEDGKLRWTDGAEAFGSDPNASAGRRFQAWFARVLRIDSQL